MSNQVKHTAEPWKLHRSGQSVGSSDGYGVCEVWPRDEDNFPDTEGKANARRIVACVNACRGLSTDELEKHGLVSAVGTELIELKKQRDQLLAAIEKASEYIGNQEVPTSTHSNGMTHLLSTINIKEHLRISETINAAIAAAKGGAE